MSFEILQLLQSRLSRIKSEHDGRLLEVASSALETFDPLRKVTFSQSIEAYAQAATAEYSSFSDRIQKEVLSLAHELLPTLSEESKVEILAVAAQSFDETIYSKRFDLQVDAMVRKGGRCGLKVDEWGIRTDLQRSLHQAGASNRVRQTLAVLADELELIRLRSVRKAAVSLSTKGDLHMPFTDLMNDEIDVLKSGGEKFEGLRASVQRTKVFMQASSFLVEPNDLIVRRMSNGGEETYRVMDPGFHEAFHGIKAHYQMDVQKLGLPEAKSAVQSITYNISGSNARINQNSVDKSTNIAQIDSRSTHQIQLLRAEIDKALLEPDQKRDALELIDEVEDAFLYGKPKKSVVSALLSSLPHVANITSIAAAIVSLL